jgi:hypothetical protein
VNPAVLSVTPRSDVPRAFELRRGAPKRQSADEGRLQEPVRSRRAAAEPEREPEPGDPGASAPRRRSLLAGLTRRHAGFAAGGLAVAWIGLVIAGAVADSSAVNERAAALRVENATLQDRLEATRREVELVQSDAYAALEARAYGMGRGRERSFTLDRGAPAPPPIRPLGSKPGEGIQASPLDEWLGLLFGA